MKRASEDVVEDVSKRPRAEHDEDDLFHESRRRNALELINPLTEDSGNIEGRVQMIWPSTGGLRRIVLASKTDATVSRFQVEISEKCLRLVNAPVFRVHDILCFALKGAKVEPRAVSSAPSSLPLALKFAQGVAVKYVSGNNAGKIINTWKGEATTPTDKDAWFAPPADPSSILRVSEIVEEDAVAAQLVDNIAEAPPAPQAEKIANLGPDRQPSNHYSSSIEGQISSTEHTMGHAHLDSGPRKARSPSPAHISHESSGVQKYQGPKLPPANGQTKKQRNKHKKQRQRERQALHGHSSEPAPAPLAVKQSHQAVSPIPAPAHPLPHAQSEPPSLAPRKEPSHPQDASTSGPSASAPTNDPTRRPEEDPLIKDIAPVSQQTSDPALRMWSGLRTDGESYTALGKIKETHGMINVIAVVSSCRSPARTRTNEWGRSFDLVDPSNVDAESTYFDCTGLAVNCFQKKYAEWLPSVKQGDIVILRKLRITQFQGRVRGVGYHDKLRWAIYDLATRRIRPPDRGNAPEFEADGPNGFGYQYTPYWEPRSDGDEIKYCGKLADWWEALQKQGVDNVTTIQSTDRARRLHRLIADASPDMAPRGFFDCTAEILHVYPNDNGPCSVYVTDYTSSPRLHPIQASWCPPELSNYILKMEMWDAAANLARTMEPGDLWYLYNSRVIENRLGYMEGRMQLDEKVCKLDERLADNNPHLQALLQRRKEWTKDGGSARQPANKFDSKLIQDVDENTSFFNCTVEALHVDCNSRDEALLYVTDYTFHPDLPCLPTPTPKWATGLDRRIVKVVLEGGQRKRGEKIQPGSYYTIRNLRLINRSNAKNAYGRLGGDEVLIVATDESTNDDAQALLERKKGWKRELELEGTIINEEVQDPAPDFSLCTRQSGNSMTIKQIISSDDCPAKFDLIACVNDFYPSLEDAVVLRCMKCKTDLPPTLRRCPPCDDMVDTHTKCCYRFFLRLQDAEGDLITVSVSDPECPLIRGLPPADFREDLEALERFVERLKPFIGNLEDVHRGLSHGEVIQRQTSVFRFSIESWDSTPCGKPARVYGLLDCATIG
ncbi:hypothetical protein BV22DRAFT_1068672 [Leucogyrophana mollusca]|uniref:Uncharacterized protein n=1 Tax=Leucogyrophana mollusca TaxID=85980 RepID=A0ACB8BG36_9AGAM|nr:hypothetical protein BV22DRAFT_1068672 [Leucogyrophana mollusca]